MWRLGCLRCEFFIEVNEELICELKVGGIGRVKGELVR